MQQVRDRWRARQNQPLPVLDAEQATDTADPGADFVDLTILRLGLSGQRRETAEATRWLEAEDRDVLSLWWLEVSGELTRAEVAAGRGLTPQHAAVRIQRMKARLDAARAVVRALAARPGCPELWVLLTQWDGVPSPLWRKRLARHTRDCVACSRAWEALIPAEGLFAGLGLVPLPVGHLVGSALLSGGGAGAGAGASGTAGGAGASGTAGGAGAGGTGGAAGAGGTAGTGTGTGASAAATVAGGKAVAAVVAGTVALAGGVGVAYAVSGASTTQAVRQRPAAVSPYVPPARSASPAALRTRPAAPSASPKRSPAPSAPGETGPRYGQTVDAVEAAPAPDARPGELSSRPEGTPVTATGKWERPFKGSLGGTYLMFYRGDYLTITGQGYFRIRWEVAWFNRIGLLQMPTWTGLRGKLFHVASGGGRRMDDTHPGAADRRSTWMGDPSKGYITLPAGAQQMWQNEFFYLDGTVTLHQNEEAADYNVSLTSYTHAQVVADITTPPDPSRGFVRFGLVRDTGTDAAPVPQYLTRATPADPMSVAQGTQVTG